MTLAFALLLLLLLLQFITVLIILPVWKKVSPAYRPMLYLMIGGFVLGLAQVFISERELRIMDVPDILSLLAVVLVLWQARRWHVFDKRLAAFKYLLIASIIAWVSERVLEGMGYRTISWFFTAGCFLITLLAIEILNRKMLQTQVPFFRNTVFLFCTALIFYYTLSGLMELFTLVLIKESNAALFQSAYFYLTLSILTQLIYIRSVLCLPAKDKYSSY